MPRPGGHTSIGRPVSRWRSSGSCCRWRQPRPSCRGRLRTFASATGVTSIARRISTIALTAAGGWNRSKKSEVSVMPRRPATLRATRTLTALAAGAAVAAGIAACGSGSAATDTSGSPPLTVPTAPITVPASTGTSSTSTTKTTSTTSSSGASQSASASGSSRRLGLVLGRHQRRHDGRRARPVAVRRVAARRRRQLWVEPAHGRGRNSERRHLHGHQLELRLGQRRRRTPLTALSSSRSPPSRPHGPTQGRSARRAAPRRRSPNSPARLTLCAGGSAGAQLTSASSSASVVVVGATGFVTSVALYSTRVPG